MSSLIAAPELISTAATAATAGPGFPQDSLATGGIGGLLFGLNCFDGLT